MVSNNFNATPYPPVGLMPSASSVMQPYQPLVQPTIDSFKPTAPPPKKLTILYYNDIHGKPRKMPHYVTAFNQLAQQAQADGSQVIRLSGGDNHIGKSEKDWEVELQQMNLMGLDSTAYGNHESDLGIHNFVVGEQHIDPRFPTLISNVTLPPQNELWNLVKVGDVSLQPRLMKYPAGPNQPALNVGLIGVTTPDLHTVKMLESDLQGMQEFNLDKTIAVVQQQIDALKRAGAQAVILESHMGYDKEAELAKRTQGLTAIVGGHSHDELWGMTLKDPSHQYHGANKPNMVLGTDGKPVYIVQAGHAGKLIGQLQLTLGPDNTVAEVDNTMLPVAGFPRDPRADAVLDKAYGHAKQVATFTRAVDNTRIMYEPNPVAQFMADAMRQETGADIGLFRSSIARDNIEAGPFYDHQLGTLFPFKDELVVVKATGQQILEALNISAKESVQRHDPHPSLLQTSKNLRITMDEKLGKVTKAMWQNPQGQWEPLNASKTYTVAADDYMVSNKKEFTPLVLPIATHMGKGIKQVFLETVQKKGPPNTPITLMLDDRLTIKADPSAATPVPLPDLHKLTTLVQRTYGTPSANPFVTALG